MPPRRSRRTAGQDPEHLLLVEKENPVEGYVGTVAAEGKFKVEIGERKPGEEECFAKSDDESKGFKTVKNEDVEPTLLAVEDFGKKNSVEGSDGAEASCSVEVLQVDDGKGNPSEPSSPGELGSHIQKRVLSSSRRLNASSSEEEFYFSAEEKVTI